MKKILILSRADINGAGSVATDLRNFLLTQDEYEIKIFTRYSRSSADFIISYETEPAGKINEFLRAVKFKLNQKFNKWIDFKYSPFSINERYGWYSSSGLLKKLNGFVPDIIIVMFMDGFVNFRNIYDFNKALGSEIYFYPMDMALMTGGCHYSCECEGFTMDCDNCPIFLTKNHIARKNLTFKQEYLCRFQFKVLSASTELTQQLKRSSLFKYFNIQNYILPVDSNLFKPENVTDYMGLSPTSKKILIGTQTMGLKRKGADLIIQILNTLFEKLERENNPIEVEVIIAGKADPEFTRQIRFKKTAIGRLSLKSLVKVYNLSDVFISASREDSGPMMINQSLLCGTPVVSFDVGVAKDLVIDYETGFKIDKFNVADFASKLEYLLDLPDEKRQKIRTNCRNLMMNIKRPRI